MRIAIATVQVPFIKGGAEYHASGLLEALKRAGHEVDIVTRPFRFGKSFIKYSIDEWRRDDFNSFDVGSIDSVIALKFPAYNLIHPNKVVWLLHQHRSVYELLNTPNGEDETDSDVLSLRGYIIKTDNESLSSAKIVYTNSKTVSARLKRYNKIPSTPLYHPPPNSESYTTGPIFPYIFCPSRLETLKRQDLLIRAVPFLEESLFVVLAGVGGAASMYQELAEELGIVDRVRFVGHISEEQKRRYYSNALAVFFAPYQEDLGYVTLEAMLASKPVITCADSGGPTEFVVDGETGFITEPDPVCIAERINFLWAKQTKAKELGHNGSARYMDMHLSWDNVVSQLTEAMK